MAEDLEVKSVAGGTLIAIPKEEWQDLDPADVNELSGVLKRAGALDPVT